MDRISYVKGSNNLKTDGSIDILEVKNNSLQALVKSQNGTFVNHAQAYYPGWKAYVDGKKRPNLSGERAYPGHSSSAWRTHHRFCI